MDAAFSSWLYRIAYNTAITELRKKERMPEVFQDDFNDHNNEYETEPETTEAKSLLVHEAIDRLPKDEAVIITLYYFEELPVKEMAKILNMTTSNIKIKLFRARKKLEENLQKKLEETYI